MRSDLLSAGTAAAVRRDVPAAPARLRDGVARAGDGWARGVEHLEPSRRALKAAAAGAGRGSRSTAARAVGSAAAGPSTYQR